MGYSETTNNYNDIRTVLRDLYIDGYKTCRDFYNRYNAESSKATDNKKRRIFNIFNLLGEDIPHYSTENGKVHYLPIDSRTNTNPLYKTFETKKFNTQTLIFYFIIIQYFSDGKQHTLTEIANYYSENYDSADPDDFIDPNTIRNRLNKLVKCGIMQKIQKKNKDIYYIPQYNTDWSKYGTLISFFSETAELGILGYFIKKDLINSQKPDILLFKHHFIVFAIDSEITYTLLQAINEKKQVIITHSEEPEPIICTPLKIFTSTRLGRQYSLVFSEKENRFLFIRLDKIVQVKTGKTSENFNKRLKEFNKIRPFIWGTSLGYHGNFQNPKTCTITMTIQIEETEPYVLDRLIREGRNGTIKKTGASKYTYQRTVFDPNEMIPWIRTFYGRILSFDSDDTSFKEKIYDDVKILYQNVLQNRQRS